MATRKILDTRPGSVPDIRAVGDSVMYVFAIAGTAGPTQLVIRCDPDGNVRASIDHGYAAS